MTPEELLYLEAMHESFRSWLKVNLYGKDGALHRFYNQHLHPAYTLKRLHSTRDNLEVLNNTVLIMHLPVH